MFKAKFKETAQKNGINKIFSYFPFSPEGASCHLWIFFKVKGYAFCLWISGTEHVINQKSLFSFIGAGISWGTVYSCIQRNELLQTWSYSSLGLMWLQNHPWAVMGFSMKWSIYWHFFPFYNFILNIFLSTLLNSVFSVISKHPSK